MSGQTVQHGINFFFAQPVFGVIGVAVGALVGWRLVRFTTLRVGLSLVGFVVLAMMLGYIMIWSKDHFRSRGGWSDAQAALTDQFLVGFGVCLILSCLAGLLSAICLGRLVHKRISKRGAD